MRTRVDHFWLAVQTTLGEVDSAATTNKEGKAKGASASHEPSEAREPRCDDPVPRSSDARGDQSDNQSSKGTDDVTSET